MKRKAFRLQFLKLKKFLPGIQKNISLKDYTTFKIGGRAKYFLAVETKGELMGAIRMAKKINLPFFILGRGGNLLVSDRGYNGLIVKIQNSKMTLREAGSKIQNSRITAEAGAIMGGFVNAAAEAGLSGLEWAAGIPGTVGGAVCGNAGAFGFSLADIVENVEVLKVSGSKIQILNYKKEDCEFGYRESIFKHQKNLIILSAKFRLKKKKKSEIRKRIKETLSGRRKNQPIGFPSAGSIFKNFLIDRRVKKKLFKKFPELEKFRKTRMIPAGFLIERCNLKGKKVGRAKISEIHANFIVNLGKAKAKDVEKLINFTKQKVKKKFGIVLEEEIRYLGFSTLDNIA